MSDGQGFQWTPEGPAPIVENGGQAAVGTLTPAPATIPAAAAVQQLRDLAAKRELAKAAPASGAQVDGSEPVDVLRLAKKRRTWLKAEIRKLRRHEQELEQLERLLNGPVRPVRDIQSARQRVTG